MVTPSPYDKRIAALVAAHQYDLVDYPEWCDYVLDGFVEDMEKLGATINPDDIRFTGFYSQGDGATWTGWVDVNRLINSNQITLDPDRLPYTCKLLTAMRSRGVSFTYAAKVVIYNTARYNNYRAMAIDSFPLCDSFSYYNCSGHIYSEAQRVQLAIADQHLDEEHEQVREMVLEWAQDMARKLYRDLEAEYYALTSDEVVREYLESNGLLGDFADEAA